MAKYNVAIHSKILKLRNKLGNNLQLNNILWYSIPKVYTTYDKDICEVNKELQKKRSRRARWFRYVREMRETFPKLFLVTLTFDEKYEKNADVTKLEAVRDYFNRSYQDWFCCADYGKKNQRLHFHCIAYTDYPLVDYVYGKNKAVAYRFLDEKLNWSQGFYSIKLIADSKVDDNVSIKYALKSASYSLKSSDDGCKPFHKRGVIHMKKLNDYDELPF